MASPSRRRPRRWRFAFHDECIQTYGEQPFGRREEGGAYQGCSRKEDRRQEGSADQGPEGVLIVNGPA
jgi:hypothetical protein